MARIGDPRETITPDAFSVAPELIGMPLARPWRRGAAMVIDLALIGLLSLAGWFFLGIGTAVIFFRIALRRSAGALRKGMRLAVFGSLGTATAVVTLWGSGCFGSFVPAPGDVGEAAVESALGINQPTLRAVTSAFTDYRTLTQAQTEPEVREASRQLSERLQGLGVESAEIRALLDSLSASREEPWVPEAVRAGYESVLHGELEEPDVVDDPDSLVFAYTQALREGDSTRVAAVRGRLGEAFAADLLRDQRDRIAELEEDKRRLNVTLQEAEEGGGLVSLILRVANEIGIELGWSALYFTLFPLFWSGRTPGKRLLRIRVVRLDAKPLGWWSALNRFGGYAASIFTGLLGFFEMFWDDNRQALQDRIASTVVVHERRGGRAAMAEAAGR